MPVSVLVGYDGSPAASAAIGAGGLLFPDARAWIAHLWAPPFTSRSLRQRLWSSAHDVSEFVEAIEREGEREADRLAAVGVTLARAAGWDAEPLVERSYGGEGLHLAQLAGKVRADLAVLGSRGLGGTRAVLGSVSDMVVHYAPLPVLVVPHPLLSAEHAALAEGPVLVGYDGSAGAEAAIAGAARLFPTRELVPVTVDYGQDRVESGPSGAGGGAREWVRVDSGRGGSGTAIAETLAECASDRAAAAVVVGSRGRSAVRELLLGSVAMATLHHAYRPVVVVPHGEPAG